MTPLALPEGLKLAPQELRVFNALQDWADRRAIERAIKDDPTGRQCWTPAPVILSKLKRKVAPHGYAIERDVRPGVKRWRIVKAEPMEAAA